MTGAGLYIFSLFLSAIGAWAISRPAAKIGLVDCPNVRSSHARPTPKGGGIGIFFVFLVAAIVLKMPMSFWLPMGIMAAVAFWDDRVDLSAKLRLAIQLGLIAGVIVAGSGNATPQGMTYCLWVTFWTVFIVGTANYFNFMDGINGIAGISGVLGFGFLALYMEIIGGPDAIKTMAICLSLSCLGFLPFNMPHAKVFMGDIGSILLGAVFAGLIWMAAGGTMDFICMASFLFPFYADELTTLTVRLKSGENITQPHRRHYYQLLANEKGVAHWKISVGYGLFQAAVCISVLMARPYGVTAVLGVLAGWSAAFGIESLRVRNQMKKPERI